MILFGIFGPGDRGPGTPNIVIPLCAPDFLDLQTSQSSWNPTDKLEVPRGAVFAYLCPAVQFPGRYTPDRPPDRRPEPKKLVSFLDGEKEAVGWDVG